MQVYSATKFRRTHEDQGTSPADQGSARCDARIGDQWQDREPEGAELAAGTQRIDPRR